ncbi:phosphatidylinositol 4-kinase gamma 4 [Selaginella moellendorffii]|nr:phosphatidylinositol 4-kinase gamma 4 [Selaginella moellendorffii]|eukprot:XP_002975579.2 phosphatidylinositol 4-kinase gamma 4 [Selaginella moellendorffii]
MATSGVVLRPLDCTPSPSSPRGYGCNSSGVAGDGSGEEEEESIQIFVAMAGKALIPLRILTSDTIASVKMRIQSLKRGMYVKQQKLVHDGRELARDTSRVKDYGIRPRDVIHLVLRVSDLLQVVVKSGGGREYMLKVDRSSSRKPAARSQSLSTSRHEDQGLILRGERLDDKRLIEDFLLEDDAEVHIVARKAAKVRTWHVGGGGTEVFIEDEKRSKRRGATALIESGVVSCQPEIQVPESLLDMLGEINAGLDQGFSPVLSSAGTGGAYCMLDRSGSKALAIFKPMDEEPMAENNPRGLPLSISGEGLKRGTIAGQGALREVAAYVLDHPRSGPRALAGKNEKGFAGVPPTVMVRCCHAGAAFSEPEKLGSLQQFVYSWSNCEDMGPARFPVDEVHKIAILDIRLANTDRNGSNILVCESPDTSSMELVPIDHGYCLPSKFEDCTFEWLTWNQSRHPFSKPSLEYIASLDADKDLELLEQHGWRIGVESARVLRVSTMLLQRGAAAGLCAFDIGSMMCRDALDSKSAIERMLEEAEGCVLPETSQEAFMEALAQVMDYHFQQPHTQR